MAAAELHWRGLEEVDAGMAAFTQTVMYAVHRVATYFAGVMETYAKANASWTDRTGNARQTLHGRVEPPTADFASDVVTLYLEHGADYGLWLEIRWAGRYAIIWPTISAHLPQIAAMLQGIFR